MDLVSWNLDQAQRINQPLGFDGEDITRYRLLDSVRVYTTARNATAACSSG